MPKGRENVYVCREGCGRHLVTVDRDEGTTPFMLMCGEFNQPGCGGNLTSSFYPTGPKPAHIGAPTHEWFSPTPAELLAECERYPFAAIEIREHVKLGGLLLRRIESIDTTDALTLADRQRSHAHRMATYDVVFADWEKGGRVGAPPPLPKAPGPLLGEALTDRMDSEDIAGAAWDREGEKRDGS